MINGIVIPCYNEEKRLDSVRFTDFLEDNRSYTLCFVNDGSSDNTIEVLNQMSASFPERIHIVDLERNSGKAEAVRQGVLYLLDNTGVQSVGYLDADLATDFQDYNHLVEQLEASAVLECAVGSRKLGQQEEIRRSPFRAFASAVASLLISLIVGLPVKDTQCGAKVFSHNLARRIFATSFYSRWLFDVELFIRIKRMFGHVTLDYLSEIPLQRWKEVEGSKITLNDTLNMPISLLEIGYFYHLEPKIEFIVGTILFPFRQLVRS